MESAPLRLVFADAVVEFELVTFKSFCRKVVFAAVRLIRSLFLRLLFLQLRKRSVNLFNVLLEIENQKLGPRCLKAFWRKVVFINVGPIHTEIAVQPLFKLRIYQLSYLSVLDLKLLAKQLE